MKQVMVVLFLLMASFSDLYAQRSGDLPKPEKLDEPDLHQPRDLSPWAGIRPGLKTSFVSTNLHQDAFTLPATGINKKLALSAWRGERVNCEVLVWSKEPVQSLTVSCTDFKDNRGTRLSSHPHVRLIKNVLAERSAGKCGNVTTTLYKPLLIPDLIEDASVFNIPAYTCRAVWISLDIPETAAPGAYSGKIDFTAAGSPMATSLEWSVQVVPRTIQNGKAAGFDLNIWQNPYQVASYNNVAPWSDAHFSLMKPAMRMLADAGQTCITTSFFWDSFNTESKGLSNAMIICRKQKDGSWIYDYAHFDGWVNFMMSLGIKDEIAVFGLDSWYPNLWYWDESLQREVNLKVVPGSPEYSAFWTPLLKDFRDHLVHKRWLGLVTIAIDERPFNSIKSDISFVRSVDTRFRFQVSGLYNPLLEPDIYDYALNSNQKVPDQILESRNRMHKKTSFYTACWEIKPNSLICNEPGDTWFLPLYSFANGMTRFSRYAFNNWSEVNLKDARNSEVPPGDAFFIYPGSRTSVRFEKLKEGISTALKFSQLINEARNKGDKQMGKKLEALLMRLKPFESPSDLLIKEEENTLNKF